MIIIIYFSAILIIGLLSSKSSNNKDNYFFASRRITIIPFVATLVTTWYGGILSIGDFTATYGISTWISFGLFYYLAALIFSFYFAPKIQQLKISSLPSFFKTKLGKASSLLTSIIMLMISSPAPYIMIFCIIISHIYKLSLLESILGGITYSVSYIYRGGFTSVIKTDKLQFILMYLGFILILYNLFTYTEYNNINALIDNIPEEKFAINWYSTLPWFIVALTTFIDPNIIQRTYSGKNIKTVKKGFIYSIFLWIIFDFLTISVGLFATIPELGINNNEVYLKLAEEVFVNKPFLKSIFFISLLSIVMSTIDSYSFTSSMIIGRDIVPMLFNKNDTVKNTKLSIIFTIIIASVLILIIGYDNINFVIDFWWFFGCLGGCMLIIPYILLLNNYIISRPIIVLILPGLIFIVLNVVNSNINSSPISIYISLLASIFINLLFSKKLRQ